MRENDSLHSNSKEEMNNVDIEHETHQGALNVKDIANRLNSNRRKTSFKPAWAKSLPKNQKADYNQKEIERKTKSSSIPFRNSVSTTTVDDHAHQEIKHDVKSGRQEQQRYLDKDLKPIEQGTMLSPNSVKIEGYQQAKFRKDQDKVLQTPDKTKQFLSPNSVKSNTSNGNDQHQGDQRIINKLKPSTAQHSSLGEGGRDRSPISDNFSVDVHNGTNHKDLAEENQISSIKSRIASFSNRNSTGSSINSSIVTRKKEIQNKDYQEVLDDRAGHLTKKYEAPLVQIDKKSSKDLPSSAIQVEQKSTTHFWRNQMKRNSGDSLNDQLKKEVPISEESSDLREKKVFQEESTSMTSDTNRVSIEDTSKTTELDHDQKIDSDTNSKFHSPQVEFITTSESVGTNIMIWKQREKQNENAMKPIEPRRWKQHNIQIGQPRHISRKPEEKVQTQSQQNYVTGQTHSSQTGKSLQKNPQHLQGTEIHKPSIISENEVQGPPQNSHQVNLRNEVNSQVKSDIDKMKSSSVSEQKSPEWNDVNDQERYKNFRHRNTHDFSFESQEASLDVEELEKHIGFKQNRNIDTDIERQTNIRDSENIENYIPSEKYSSGTRIELKSSIEETPLRSNRSLDLSNTSREEISFSQCDESDIKSPSLLVSQLKKQLWGTGEKLKTWQSKGMTPGTDIQTSKSEDEGAISHNDMNAIANHHIDTNEPLSQIIHETDESDKIKEYTESNIKPHDNTASGNNVDDDSQRLPVSQLKKHLWGTGEKLKTWQSKGMTHGAVVQMSKSKDDGIILSEGMGAVTEYEEQSSPSQDISHNRSIEQDDVIQTSKRQDNGIELNKKMGAITESVRQEPLNQDTIHGKDLTLHMSKSEDEGIIFKDRFYRAAKVAQLIDGDRNAGISSDQELHRSIHRGGHDFSSKINPTSNLSPNPESMRPSRLLSSDAERKTEDATHSVEKLLEKLAAALNSKDDPGAALKEIDSILRKEREGLGEDKNQLPVQTTIMEDETLADSNVDEFANVHDGFSDDDEDEYSDDDSTVSSITNPTYHESFQRHSPRPRGNGLVYQTGPHKGLPLPSAKPMPITHPKVLEQFMSSERHHGDLYEDFHGVEEAGHAQFGTIQNLSLEKRGESFGLQSSLSPVKAFSEKGRSMNNKGLLSQIKGWDDLDDDDVSQTEMRRQRMSANHPSPPFSPSERLKRLANAATKYEQRQNLRHQRQDSSRVFFPSGDESNKIKAHHESFDTNGGDWESIPGFDFFKSHRRSNLQALNSNSFVSKSIPEQVSELRKQQRERNSVAHRTDLLDQT